MLIAIVIAALVLGWLFLLAVVPQDRIAGVGVGLVTALFFLASSPSVPEAVRDITLIGGLVLLALAALSRPWPRSLTHPVVLLVFIFYVVSIVSTLIVFPSALNAVLRFAALAVIAAVVVSQFTRRDVLALVKFLVGFAVFQVALGVVEVAVLGKPVLWGYGALPSGLPALYPNTLLGEQVLRVQGTAGHPIPYAMLLAVAFVIVLHLHDEWRLRFRLGLLSILTVGLVLSGTRSALVAVAIVLAVKLVTTRSEKRILSVFAVGVAAVIVVVLLGSSIADAYREFTGTGSFYNRVGALASVPALLARDLREVLFGSGVGSEASLFGRGFLQQNGFNIVDNQLVTTLATGGVIGLVLLLLIIGVAVKRSDPLTRALIIVMVVAMFSFDYLRWFSMIMLLIVVVALPSASSGYSDESFSQETTRLVKARDRRKSEKARLQLTL
ncbi:O-antigen ligase family protein [Frigoribacterium sp. CFBP9030]|uniref:O-antigen ligase family protein n=1 Tax=Frigoribacterium sp. CFBP9030 TaxID=3096537 RepID=UPI002A69D390|nr:O-antigen ligase family protein [Frigoribacterium sp. CFBP9030]MDY0892244.1 hypothetical protein [Frigoribacterium sp. CFBP9030]